MTERTRTVDFQPGYDCIRFECKHGSKNCKPGGGGSHGRHGLTIRWVLRGKKGAVQFVLNLPDSQPEPPGYWNHERLDRSKLFGPLPTDLGYHSPVPRYEGQEPMSGECDVLGGPCYYDGSGLNAEHPYRVLCNDGGEALWEYLERYYAATFEGAEYPTDPVYKWAKR